jgi:cytochrome c oxidase subunit 1
MLFAIGVVSQFTIGGLSGVTHAVSPADTQQHDSYYIVAHFHYVLFGGSMFGVFAGIYYWWPKIFGRQLSESIGKLQFWVMLVGFNLTFGPMHILGLQGQPRRTATYAEGMGWDLMNLLATIGSFTIGVSFLIWIFNVVRSRTNVITDNDPWDARTLEWGTSSPPPAHNFDVEPTASHLDEWWHRKYEEDEHGRPVRRASVETFADPTFDASTIHLPSPSYWPILLAVSMPLVAYGLIYSMWFTLAGGVLMFASIYGWALEPSVDPDTGHGHDDHHEPPTTDPDAEATASEVEAVPAPGA